MGRKKNLQVVWPKDGRKGKSKRGFFGGFSDICFGKGPDMFLQHEGSLDPIKPDRWGNWDTYHHNNAYLREAHGPQLAHRGDHRYDPHSRTYVQWGEPQDWDHLGYRKKGPNVVPWFTQNERTKIIRDNPRGRRVNPSKMGSDWDNLGPKRWRPHHQWFWSNAHRIGHNAWSGVPLGTAAWNYPYGLLYPSQLDQAVQDEFY